MAEAGENSADLWAVVFHVSVFIEKILSVFFTINDYFNCAASDLYRQITECSIDDASPFNFL